MTWWKRFFIYFLIWSVIYILVLAGILIRFGRRLPSLQELENFRPKLITTVYSADGQVLKRFAEQRREYTPYERIPTQLIDAVVATEGRRFWQHWGLDLSGIFRAALSNLKAGRIVQGGSTITQQLARNLFLSQKVSLERKIKEQLTAIRIERAYSKPEILEMYLNQVYFGHGAWGAQAASRLYFSKDVENLSLNQCATLAGLLKAPTIYSPLDYPLRAIKRRNHVLRRMAELQMISKEKAEEISNQDLELNPQLEEPGEAPYFVEYVRQQLEKKYGSQLLYEEGVSVYTTLNLKLQKIAEKVLLEQLARRQKIAEEQFALQDSLRTRVVQGALVAIDPHNGHILAMVGGRDFKESKFNRATQALRQPGSAFKPFVYTAAVDNGYRPTDLILDTPISLPMPDGTLWQPENYDRIFKGPVTLRQALAESRNVATIQLLMKLTPKVVRHYAQMMGISSPLSPVYSLAIGSSDVRLIELVSAYGVFPNRGIRVEPIAVLSIIDRNGNIIEQREKGREKEVLRASTAYVMTSMLESVMDEGTGRGARLWYGFRRAAGGKTGTTNDFTDAWFVGFIPQMVAGVWIGFDEKIPLGKEHASAAAVALPVWARFMKAACDSLELPVEDFEMPSTVVSLEICTQSHKIATPYCPRKRDEVFIRGTEPTESCPLHQGPGKILPEPDEKSPQRGKLEF
ncbi:MAG: PBP1A family penicillin-binding protein [Candidatus Latescibacteria bacterium]|nr:PBP1A family penicillin-binding protein [Candidatus Latescibacterota bacterium]